MMMKRIIESRSRAILRTESRIAGGDRRREGQASIPGASAGKAREGDRDSTAEREWGEGGGVGLPGPVGTVLRPGPGPIEPGDRLGAEGVEVEQPGLVDPLLGVAVLGANSR